MDVEYRESNKNTCDTTWQVPKYKTMLPMGLESD